MSNQIIGLFVFDQEFLVKFRKLIGSPFLEDHAAIWANIHAWAPVFVFFVVMLYVSKPKAAVASIFLCLGAFVLSYQAASILSNYFMQPAPWKVEYWLTQAELPAFANGADISMPDWQIATMAGALQFTRLRLRAWGLASLQWAWFLVLVFSLIRIYAGFTYPSGAVVAILIGSVIGWLVYQLGRNLELLQANEQGDPTTPASEEKPEE